MSRFLWRESFAEEHMAKVSAAVVAEDFRPRTIQIGFPFDRIGDLVVKARPPAFAVEFGLGTIQWRIAAPTDVGAQDLTECGSAGWPRTPRDVA